MQNRVRYILETFLASILLGIFIAIPRYLPHFFAPMTLTWEQYIDKSTPLREKGRMQKAEELHKKFRQEDERFTQAYAYTALAVGIASVLSGLLFTYALANAALVINGTIYFVISSGEVRPSKMSRFFIGIREIFTSILIAFLCFLMAYHAIDSFTNRVDVLNEDLGLGKHMSYLKRQRETKDKKKKKEINEKIASVSQEINKRVRYNFLFIACAIALYIIGWFTTINALSFGFIAGGSFCLNRAYYSYLFLLGDPIMGVMFGGLSPSAIFLYPLLIFLFGVLFFYVKKSKAKS